MSPEMNDFAEFIGRLTDNARGSLQQADIMARTLGSAYIGTEHLLLGVLSQSDSVGAKLLFDSGVDLDRAQLALKMTPKNLIVTSGARGLSETAKLTLRMSWNIAQEFNQEYCGTEHILYSILTQKNARATVLLRDMSVDTRSIIDDLEQYLARQNFEYDSASEDVSSTTKRRKKPSILDVYGTDLTDQAQRGELDPMIGREAQLARMIIILGRRTKNNPVLIGEPGVGKTALVEGLAQRIASEEVPEYLVGKRVISLDLAAMIAGTKYRGEFEERLKKIVAELSNDSSTIVFIDELHLLIGAGAAEGSIDAANMLKPALARGSIRMIGATTIDEYRKHIEKDAALERRLQTITVPEPTIKETIAIIEGLSPHYEQYHGVEISSQVIKEAVELAQRYRHDRFMPDKAIDVLDEAAAYVRMKRGKTPIELKRMTQETRNLTEKMEEAVVNEDYERAALYKTRISQLQEKTQALQQKHTQKSSLVMNSDDVSQAIATITSIPVSSIKKKEAQRLLDLEKHIARQLIGQAEAVTTVSRSIRRGRAGIGDARRPIGSFIFMGPTGVGKTELARVLAQEVFGSTESFIKIDMSEYNDRHTSARLVGAPAGYIGHDDGGQLTNKIRQNPYSVVVFDEIEKAHPDVLNMLLQILEDGQLTDGKGRTVSFANTVIILTSNLGAEAMQRESQLGFQSTTSQDASELQTMHEHNERAARQELEKRLRPELINRFDDIIVFRALTRAEVKKVLSVMLAQLNDRLSKKGIAIKVTPTAKKWLIDRGYDPKNGARPMRRLIQTELEAAIADGVLAGTYQKGHILRIGTTNGRLTIGHNTES